MNWILLFLKHRFGLVKYTLLILCLIPLAINIAYIMGFYFGWMSYQTINEVLGVNPQETLIRDTGEWGLRILLATLLMTPLSRLLQRPWPIKLRRMLGLLAFTYISAHLFMYLWLDQEFYWGEILADIYDRPIITVGMAAFVLMIPLAVTSNRAAIKRLGRNWKRLHRSVYLIALLGILHYFWIVKKDLFWPLVYCTIYVLLMLARLLPRIWSALSSQNSLKSHS